MEFPQQILNECMWIKNCQINSNTTVVHCIPHPKDIQRSAMPRVRSPPAAKPPPSAAAEPITFDGSLRWMFRITWVSAACPLVNSFYTKVSGSKTINLMRSSMLDTGD